MNTPQGPVRLPRGALIPIAPPARGKSTLASGLVRQGLDPAGLISPDHVRWELCRSTPCACPDAVPGCAGGMVCQCQNGRVFAVAGNRCEARARVGLTYYFDGTNLDKRTRRAEVERAHRHGLPAVALLATPVSVDVLRERNSSRSRQVPDEVLVRMHARHAAVTVERLLEEGFDQVVMWDDDTTFEVMPCSTDGRKVSGPFAVIGDVHGCYNTLRDLLTVLGFDESLNHPDGLLPVLVGDLHDKGGEVATGPFGSGDPSTSGAVRTLRMVMEMVDAGRMLVVDSNHGNKLVRKILRPDAVKASPALVETLGDIDAQPDSEALRQRLVQFLGRVPVSLRLPGGPTGEFIVAHAAMVRGYEDRNDRKAAGVCNYLREFDWTGPETVVVGHVVVEEPTRTRSEPDPETPDVTPGEVIRIDTGAYEGGGLTAYLPSEDRFVSVPTNPLDLPVPARLESNRYRPSGS